MQKLAGEKQQLSRAKTNRRKVKMDLDEYQEKAKLSDTFNVCSLMEAGFLEKVLGLAGESGEVVDKLKKILRDKDGVINEEDRNAVVKELGDVLWYVASIARYLGMPLSDVAKKNLEKLESRRMRGKLHGEGDDR